jgi:outer membrane protein
MMLKKLIPIAAAVGLTAAFTVPMAQTRATRIGFVTAQSVLKAHPQGATVLASQQKAQNELKALADKITEIQRKIANNTATAADRQQYETLAKTYQARGEQLKKNIDKQLEPITKQVDAAVAKVAKQQGFALVMDRAIAGTSGLVIYADPEGTDLTDEVVAEVKK